MNVLALAAIFLAFGAGLLLTVAASRVMLVERGALRQRLRNLAAHSTTKEPTPTPAAIHTDRSRALSQGSWSARTALQLERAGLQLKVSEYLAIRLLAALLGFLLVALISSGHPIGLVVAASAAVLGFMLPALVVNALRARRVSKLNDQLEQMVSMVSNSLKAGFGLLQSLEQAAEQLSPPLSNELLRLIHETNVGATLEEALAGLTERVESHDLDMIVTAILIQRTVGGNLAEILDNVGSTIRERVRIQGEVGTLTAQKKLSALIIGLLPVVVVALFFVVSPDYMSVLFTHPVGRILLVIGAALDLVGLLMIRRIVTIEV